MVRVRLTMSLSKEDKYKKPAFAKECTQFVIYSRWPLRGYSLHTKDWLKCLMFLLFENT